MGVAYFVHGRSLFRVFDLDTLNITLTVTLNTNDHNKSNQLQQQSNEDLTALYNSHWQLSCKTTRSIQQSFIVSSASIRPVSSGTLAKNRD